MDSLYKKVKEDIEKKIKDGVYSPGDYIPCESELEGFYKVTLFNVIVIFKYKSSLISGFYFFYIIFKTFQ